MAEKTEEPVNIKAYPEDAAFIDAQRKGIFKNRQDYVHYLVDKERSALDKEKENGEKGILPDAELRMHLMRSGFLSAEEAAAIRREGRNPVHADGEDTGDEQKEKGPPDRGKNDRRRPDDTEGAGKKDRDPGKHTDP